MPAVTVSTEEAASPDETLTSLATLAIMVPSGRLDLGHGAFMTPERLVEPDAWVGHIPFAFWLVEAHRPRTLVELGTHSGNSYCAFCQGVTAFGLGTSCYAVDTWAGDPQAGFYGEEVYDELRRYHDPRYGAFSRLVRSTFDEAAAHFADGSIDLLHIDGYHVYDAVRHDFDTWLPKLSERGIVLLHDINVRERDFGAWRFWQEATSGRPSFSFLHSHGLGVLGIGNDLPEAVVALLDAPAARAIPIRQWFASTARSLQVDLEASRLRETVRAQAAIGATLAEERSRLGELESSRSELERRLAEVETSRSALERRLADVETSRSELERDLFRATAERDTQRASATAASAETRRTQADRNSLLAEREVLQRELTRREVACDHLARELSKHRRRRQKMRNSLFWRVTRPLRAAVGVVAKPLTQKRKRKLATSDTNPPSQPPASEHPHDPDRSTAATEGGYAQWVAAYDTLTEDDEREIGARIAALPYKPLISIIMPIYNAEEGHLRSAIESVRAQIYEHWQLCIADDASTAPHVRRVLEDYAHDARVSIVYREVNGHIAAASNSALEVAKGDFVALMDHDDLLPKHSIYQIVSEINLAPDADLIYSDEDRIDEAGERFGPYFKPDWDPDLMLVHNMVSHLGVYRRALVNSLGGFRVGYEGSQDYDLALRVTAKTTPSRIRHVPAILYHWRQNRSHASFSSDSAERCATAARRAIGDMLAVNGTNARVLPLPAVPLWHRVSYSLPEPPPPISVIIPTRDRGDLLSACLDGLLQQTDYESLEIIIVDNDSTEPQALKVLERVATDPRVKIIRFAGTFNFSAMNNLAAEQASGEVLLLLNNDVEVIDPGWLTEMVSHACRDGVGAVGAKLLYPSGKVQHAGIVLGVGGVANHFGYGADRYDPGYFGLLVACRSMSAVTGACLAVRRSVYLEVGGLNDRDLKVAFNDVDFCLRLRERGYRNVFTPFAELYHHESASRGSDLHPEKIVRFKQEVEYMMHRWGKALPNDPFYNPNFDLRSSGFELAWPPRRDRPWASCRGAGDA